MFKLIASIIFLFTNGITGLAQDVKSRSDTVYIEFRPASLELTRSAKTTLDSLAELMQSDSTLGLKITASNKDLYDESSSLAFSRAKAIVRYISPLVPGNHNFSPLTLLTGELNKVAIVLSVWTPLETLLPHPGLKPKNL